MISIRNLSRRYGDVVAVNDVSVDIQRGEIVGLLGHNGAGKTTMMKMLTGFIDPTAGSIAVDGLDVVRDRIPVQRRLGYLPESAPTYPEMRVHEYLRLVAELRGVPSSRIDATIADAARQTGLLKHLDSSIGKLSKGYRQRVGIAQAILHHPDVLVLDEPTNGLDPVQIRSVRELIQHLGKDTTILLSTHILQEVEAVCDRVLIMINGRLAADAPLSDLLSSDTIRLCVQNDAPDVEQALHRIEHVRKVSRIGRDDDRHELVWWSIEPAPGKNPTSEIIAAGAKAGWVIDSIARESRTLDTVYQQLQSEWVDKQQVEAR